MRGTAVQALYLIQTAFTIWMMVDCFRRGGAAYWYLIMWAPFGPLVYFLAVKIHDFDLRPLRRLVGLDRPPSTATLRYRLQETDSLANKLTLAQALVEASEAPDEAAALFRDVLRRDPQDKRALHGLARAQLVQGERAGALETLDGLVARAPAFSDGEALRQRADLLWEEGRRDEAVGELERLVRQYGKLSFHVALAQRLIEAERAEQAKQLLDEALEGYRHAPRYIQRRDARARREASALRGSLAARKTSEAR